MATTLLRVLIGCVFTVVCWAQSVSLQPGDLLFQDLDCGYLCDGIGDVTTGYQGAKVSHVGMVVSVQSNQVMVIEANTPRVSLVSLQAFLARSVDQHGVPRVMVGRLKAPYNALIPMAIIVAESLLGRPYNADFHPNGYSQYCSQLIYVAFKWANHGVPIFEQRPMDYRRPGEFSIDPAWRAYFHTIDRPVTQGLMGISPAMLSLSPLVTIVSDGSAIAS